MADNKQKALDDLTDKFPARYRVKQTTNLLAILDALAEGDSYVRSQIEAVRDNLLVLTATSKHLDRLASIYGIVRGQASGIQDEDFKKLIPVLGTSKKQVTHALQAIIDSIYGPYASHANTTCSAPAPYKLVSGSSLKVNVDGQQIEIFFKATDAKDLSAATAEEIAAAISDRTNGRVIGSVLTNTRTGENFVNLRCKTIGSQGFIQVTGGDAQAALRFPQIRPTRQSIATWSVARYLGTDEMVYATVSGVSPGLRTAEVKRGDYVTIRHDSGFAHDNTGTFEVTFVDEDSFRVKNKAGSPEASVTTLQTDDFCFYRPDMGNVLLSARPATIVQTDTTEITVILPVTSPIVKRTLKGGHHFHGGVSVSISTTATTLTLGSVMGFESTGAVHIVSARDRSEGSCSSVTGNSINLVDAANWPTSGAVYAPTTQTFYYFSGRTGNTLTGVSPTPPSDIAGSPLKYSSRFRYTGITGNTLTGVYPDPSPTLGLEVTSTPVLSPGFIGSFLFDKASPFTCAVDSTNLKETIQQGSSRTVVGVNDIDAWPKQGYFVIEYATKEQEGPIRYLGKVGKQALIIDPGHIFERDHLKGTTMRLVRQVGTFSPRPTGDDYAVYLTGTSAARSLLAQYLMDIIAAGITLKFKILVPEQKWPVLPLLHSNNPLDKTLATFE